MNNKEKLAFIKEKIKINYKVSKCFGIKYGLSDFLATVIFRSKSNIGKKIHIYEHEIVKKYLKNKYNNILERFEYKEPDKISDTSPIWILWWQGIENAPLIVKKCIESVMSNANKHSVVIIDKNNYAKYIKLPEYIIKKVENQIITITQFSDILRMSLLYEHGGIWMDATIFAVSDFSKDFSKYSIYSIKHCKFSEYHVCKGMWSGFFLAASKGNCIVKLFRDFFLEYWKFENCLITYFLIDCIIALCYENNFWVKKELDKIPCNNSNVFEMQTLLKKEFDEENFKAICENNDLFKVSWKLDFSTSKNNTYLDLITDYKGGK